MPVAGNDAVFLHQQRHQIAAIAFAVALDAADLVEEGRQDPRVGVSDAGEGLRFVGFDVGLDQRLARLLCPLVQAFGRVVDIPIEKAAVIRIEHDLADR